MNQPLPFKDYIEQQKTLIQAKRCDLNKANAKQIIEANSPFEYPENNPSISNSKCGILLIHGLLDSPYILQDLGKYLAEKGFLVRAILLPGHGTNPDELLQIKLQDWLDAVQYGLESFEGLVNELYVLGFSLGASLALYHALNGYPLAGLIQLSPALKIKTPLAKFAKYHSLISKWFKSAAWLTQKKEIDYAKYISCPLNAVAEVYELTQRVKNLQKKKPLAIPQFYAVTDTDETIDSSAVLSYFKKTDNAKNRLILYSNKNLTVTDSRIIVRPSEQPTENIIDYSHVCLPVSPNNSHYGQQGDYKNYQHYSKSEQKKQALNHPPKWGSVTWKSTKHYFLTRLSYNPDYKFMVKAINDFLTR